MTHRQTCRETVEVPMIFDAKKWQIIMEARTTWDPFDLIGRVFDATVDAVADAVENDNGRPPKLPFLGEIE